MKEKHKVTNHLEFALFDYTSEPDETVELGDIMYRMLSNYDNKQEEIGVVIQTYGDGEFRTDMFGNACIEECSFASLRQIKRIRPELLTKLKQN